MYKKSDDSFNAIILLKLNNYIYQIKKLTMNSKSIKWSLFKKLGFRFIFIYFGLYISTFFISYLPYTTSFVRWVTYNIQSIPVWVADKFLEIEITVFPGGSGDTTYNYVEVLAFFMLAIIAAIIWSVLDRKRPNYKWN